jgi:hypothetical protein
MKRLWIGMTAVVLGVWAGGAVQAALTLTEGGKSAYVIEVAADAPKSVELAARELRDYVKRATGAALVIEKGKSGNGPAISLGLTALAKGAGVTDQGIRPGGFRTVSQGENLFILGPDTADGKKNATGGVSTGTLNGVYAFLEEQVGVRWLMPGEKGEFVPKLDALRLESIDETQAPGFARRELRYVQNDRPDVQVWLRRMRQGESIQVNHGHNWRITIPASLYNEHPDWFAEIGGKRPPPAGRYKLETTNPGLVAAYAKAAIEAFKKKPNLYCYSLSPSDSAGWSQSPESEALYDRDPHGHVSMTKLVLKFYNDVAAIVRKEAPDRILAGYIYADYLYPPAQGIGELEPNLFLVVAPSIDYGYCLYRADVRKSWGALMAAWAAHTKHLGYYDLPTNLTPPGVPQGPGIGILEFIYPKLADYGNVESMYMYGDAAWGGSAVGNYIKAKLAWNPKADARKLAGDFYRHAYGPEAGKVMEGLYDRLDRQIQKVYQADPKASYTLTPKLMEGIYAPIYPETEKGYLSAESMVTDADEKWRLEMFGKSLALLRWDLTRLGLIKADPHSPLYRTNEQIESMATGADGSLAVSKLSFLSANAAPLPKVQSVTIASAPANAPAARPYFLRAGNRFLLYSPRDEQISVAFPQVKVLYGEVISYSVRDSLGNSIKHGLLSQGTDIQFAASGGQAYFLDVSAESSFYSVKISGCHWAVRDLGRSKGLYQQGHTTPIYFQVSRREPATVLLRTDYPGGTAALQIYSPDGKLVGSLDTSHKPADQFTSAANPANGWWRIDFVPASRGGVNAVWVQMGGSASAWVGLDPQRLLSVSQRQGADGAAIEGIH